MPTHHIYQIFYSDRTRAELDPGFLPLDNQDNDRPDWREYWPIRHFLLNNTLEPEAHYGFFSPKFRFKTNLDAAVVHDFVQRHGANYDFISFSPFFDQMALPLNIVEQTIAAHPQSLEAFQQCAALVAPGFRTEASAMTSLNTVFCNYFVAKPRFWAEWLRNCEMIFQIAEGDQTALAGELNRLASYGTQTAPTKVFVIERVASLLLWSQPQWKVVSYDPMLLPLSTSQAAGPELAVLDALKIAYSVSSRAQYLAVFSHLRQTCLQRRQSTAAEAAT